MGVDSHGNAVPLEGFSPDEYSDPRLSPDGSRALVLCGSDVWILDLDRGTRRQITSDANSGVPGWSRNGDHALYVKGQSGLVSSLWRQAVRGSGIAEPIPIDADIGAWDLSPDERSVAFGERQFGTSIVVWSEDTGQVVLEESSATEAAPCFDPSGRLLTYVSNATGALEVYVRELETGETWRISREGGKKPVWSRDGRTLFYRA